MALLPVILFILIFFLFSATKNSSWREALLVSSLLVGSVITIVTEILSLSNSLTFWPLVSVWIICVLATIVLLIRKRRDLQRPNLRELISPELSGFDYFLLSGLVIILFFIGLTAYRSAPNNWDSFTYHLSRVEHWIQNKSVSFYPTHNLRQLYLNPFAEYAILNFELLNKGDKFANLVQWFSLLGCAIGISSLTHLFGVSKRGQLLSAIFSATLPMGILQGSSTQNDLVVSFWLVCFVYFSILSIKTKDLRYFPLIGIALGLAILTKGTAYIYAFPFLIWLCIYFIYTKRIQSLPYLMTIAFIVLSLNSFMVSRTFSLFKTPLLSREGNYSFNNTKMSIPLFASNLVRNTALHLGTPYEKGNQIFEKGITKFHKLIGLSVNDEDITWPAAQFEIPQYYFQEDFAGNPLHLVLLCGLILLFLVQKKKHPDTWFFLLADLAGIVLFCLIFRWQPWNSRLHLPSFILLAPITGIVLSRYQGLKGLELFSGILLLLMAIPWVQGNQMRPLVGSDNIFLSDRNDLYFSNRKHIQSSYEGASNLLAHSTCDQIGLIMESDSPEYLLWVTLKENFPGDFRLEHINVNNESRILAENAQFNDFTPCRIIVISQQPPENVFYKDTEFLMEWNSEFISIYKP